MLLKEYIEKNKNKYTVIDVDIDDIHFDTANGFVSDSMTDDETKIMNLMVSDLSVKELTYEEYSTYLGLSNLNEMFGYKKSDMFCLITKM